MAGDKMHPNFKGMFPRSVALGLKPAAMPNGADHAGFDDDDLKAALGAARYANFTAAVAAGKPYSGACFSCGHRTKNGIEVHCWYAADLELFIANGG